jgi:hypothetical protein
LSTRCAHEGAQNSPSFLGFRLSLAWVARLLLRDISSGKYLKVPLMSVSGPLGTLH